MAHNGHNSSHGAKAPGAFGRMWSRKWSFLGVSLLVFLVTTAMLGALDLLPDAANLAVNDQPSLSASASLALGQVEKPSHIVIPSIKLDVQVANPNTTDVATLDHALLSGAVRYPTSSNLGEAGNVIIFGHSSYLPVVHNQSFKAFDGIQNLKAGDRIEVTGSAHTYVYEVESVKHANAEEDAIPLDVSGSKLTLATCDSFGTKSDRFIVTANLVGSYPNGS